MVDVVSRSIGIRTTRGSRSYMNWLAHRNSMLPIPMTTAAEQVTNHRDETVMRFDVYEGETESFKANNLLGTFVLKGLPARHAGSLAVDVTFSMDFGGLITVEASYTDADCGECREQQEAAAGPMYWSGSE